MDDESPREAWKAWEAAHAGLLVDAVNRVRNAQGVTLKELATRLEEAGWPVGFPTLNGILSGRKRAAITVGEVYAFARALSVPPMYLLLGLPAGSFPGAPLLPGPLDAIEAVSVLQGWTAGDGHGVRTRRGSWMVYRGTHALSRLSECLADIRFANAVLQLAQEDKSGRTQEALPAQYASGSLLRSRIAALRSDVYLYDTWHEVEPELLPELRLPEGLEALGRASSAEEAGSVVLPLPGIADSNAAADAERFVSNVLRVAELEGGSRAPAEDPDR